MSDSRKYIPYLAAFRLLAERLGATEEEIAAWIFFHKNGGLTAYEIGRDDSDDSRLLFNFSHDNHGNDYRAPLATCWFLRQEIEQFDPIDRYITGQELLERWSRIPGTSARAFIVAKILESTLMDFHPTYGGTSASDPTDGDAPPLEDGLFELSRISAIEEDEGIEPLIKLEEHDAHLVEQSLSAGNGGEFVPANNAVGESILELVEEDIGPGKSGGLLPNPPERINEWYEAIEAMSLDFFTRNGRLPDVHEAWAALWDDPPKKFQIERGQKFGKPVLILHDDVLDRRNFKDRYKRYTMT